MMIDTAPAAAPTFEIYFATAPGLEAALAAEALAAGFADAKAAGGGGVVARGTWADVWRANLCIRGASRILARFASFRAFHLAQLDKRARKVPWAELLRPDVPFRVEAACNKSKIYHAGAAAQRIERAIAETVGAPVSADAALVIKARIDDDLCTISIDTSGEALHKRGHKEAVNKAPMRENLAALFLAMSGYTGQEPVVDPMCGSGTFVIEAAEIALGLAPGRSRSFAFEQLASFDAAAWETLKATGRARRETPLRFYGSDRDAGAVGMSRANAERAGVTAITHFAHHAISDLQPPEGPPGLVIVNPPYGGRIGDKQQLFPLYQALGNTLRQRFAGWRVGLITNEAVLANVTGLPWQPPAPPILHGGIRVTLFTTGILPAA